MFPAKIIVPTADTASALSLPAMEFAEQHNAIRQNEILSVFFKVYLP